MMRPGLSSRNPKLKSFYRSGTTPVAPLVHSDTADICISPAAAIFASTFRACRGATLTTFLPSLNRTTTGNLLMSCHPAASVSGPSSSSSSPPPPPVHFTTPFPPPPRHLHIPATTSSPATALARTRHVVSVKSHLGSHLHAPVRTASPPTATSSATHMAKVASTYPASPRRTASTVRWTSTVVKSPAPAAGTKN